MSYSDDFLSKVSSFGVLGYSIEKIIDLTDPQDEEQFRIDFNTPGSEVYKAYRRGKTTGEYNLDKNLFDLATKSCDKVSNTLLDERMGRKKVDDRINQNFGV